MKAILSDGGINLDDEGLEPFRTSKQNNEKTITTSYSEEDLQIIYQVKLIKDFAIVQMFRCGTLSLKEAKKKARKLFRNLVINSRVSVKNEKKHASIVNQMGLYYHNLGNNSKAYNFFNRARLLNREDKVFAGNTVYALSTENKYKEMMAILDKTEDKDHDLIHWEAWTLKRLKRYEESIKLYDKLLKDDYSDDDFFDDYSHLLISKDKTARLKELVKVYEPESSNFNKALVAAEYAYDFDKLDLADELLQLVDLENTKGAASLKLDILIEKEQYSKAVQLADSFIKKGVRTSAIHSSKARALIYSRNFDEARKVITEIRLGNPKFNTSSLIADLNYYEGNHSNSLKPLLIQPVELPEKIKKITDSITIPNDIQSDRFVHHHIINTQFLNKRIKKTHYLKVSILNASAINDYSTLYHSTFPKASISVNKLSVTNGKVELKAPQQKFYTTNETNGIVLSESKRVHMPVTGLKKGSTLELILTESFPYTYNTFPFTNYFFTNYSETGLKAFIFSGNINEINYKKSSQIELHQSDKTMAFYKKNLQSIEGLQYPIPNEHRDYIFLGDKSITWEEENEEYYEDIKHTLKVDPKISTLAKTIFQNTDSKEAKILAAVSYINKNYVYKALEFGKHSIVPAVSANVKECLYGDCKDLSVLLCQLLKTQGIIADPVLISTDYDIIKNLPSFDQFNHMIAWVDEKYFIDCTARSLDFKNVPISLAGKTAVIIREEGPLFKKLPQITEKKNISVEGEISLDQNGARVKDKVVFENYLASYMREWWRELSKDELKLAMIDILKTISKSPHLNNFRIEGLLDSEKPLVLNIDYTLKDSVLSTANKMYRVPELWTSYFIKVRQEKNRIYPFKTNTPLNLEISRSVKNARLLNNENWQKGSTPASAEIKTHAVKGEVTQKVIYKRKNGLWGADKFQNYNELNRETVIRTQLILHKD